MRKYWFVLAFILILLPLVSSANIQADYQIISNKVLVEVKYEDVHGFYYTLPNNYQALEINTQEYSISSNILTINSNSASFKFITDSYIDKSISKNYFILNNPFNQKADVAIYLEESSLLPEINKVISPAPSQITSDGRRIIIKWNDFEDSEIVFNYEFASKIPASTKLIILILVVIILAIIFRHLLLKRKEKKKQTTKNLYEDEKKIVEYLLEQKDNKSWTKQMVKDLKISKVKLSRKLRSLEQKGLIKKIPYGNENKIILVK